MTKIIASSDIFISEYDQDLELKVAKNNSFYTFDKMNEIPDFVIIGQVVAGATAKKTEKIQNKIKWLNEHGVIFNIEYNEFVNKINPLDALAQDKKFRTKQIPSIGQQIKTAGGVFVVKSFDGIISKNGFFGGIEFESN